MKRRLALLAAVCLALAASSSATEKKDKQAEGLALINRARELSDIRAPGSPPFRLRTRIRVEVDDGRSVEGNYTLVWISASRWREAIKFPDFYQLRVANDGKMWQVRNNLSFLMHVQRFTTLLDLISRLELTPETTARKVRDRQRKGQDLKCVELHRKGYGSWETCFDPASGTLRRVESSSAVASEYVTEYADYRSFAGKQFPGTFRSVEYGNTVVQITVVELTEEQSPDPALFAPPPDATEWAWCENPEPSKELEWGKPKSSVAMEYRGHFTFSAYGVIGVDGTLRDLTVLHSARPDIDAYVLEQLKGARFRPKMCNGLPVEEEKVFTTTYHFGGF